MTPQTILLFLIAFLVGSDEFLLGPILTPIGNDLGVAPERITLFIGAYALPLAFLSPVFGALSDRLGRRRVLLPAVTLFCLGSVGTALANDYGMALTTRVLTGIGAAGMLPVAFASAADSEPNRAPMNIAAVQAGLTCGIILAPLYGATVTAALGWQHAFAGLGIAAALTVLGIRWLGDDNSGATVKKDTGAIFIPGAAGAIIAMGFGLGGAIGIYALAGERLRDLSDLQTGGVSVVYAGFGIATLAGNLLMPRAIPMVRDGRQLMQLCLCGVLAAILLLFGLSPGLAASVALLMIWAVLGGIGAPGLQTYLAGLSESRRGLLMAIGASAMNLGVAIWSGVASALFTQSAGYVALLALVVVGIAILALHRTGRQERAAT